MTEVTWAASDMAAVTGSGTRACMVCSRTDRPLTREHVFANWLVQKVHGARLVPSGVGAPTVASSDPRISRVIATVCGSCNAGWMSSLEMSFRGTVFGRPRVGVLQAPDRVTLSRWFAKTAVLLACAQGLAFLPAVERAKLMTKIPDNVEVYIRRRRHPRQPLDFAVDVEPGRDGRVRSVAIQVDDLFAHVAPRGTLTSREGTRLWPLRTHTLRWETLPVG